MHGFRMWVRIAYSVHRLRVRRLEVWGKVDYEIILWLCSWVS